METVSSVLPRNHQSLPRSTMCQLLVKRKMPSFKSSLSASTSHSFIGTVNLEKRMLKCVCVYACSARVGMYVNCLNPLCAVVYCIISIFPVNILIVEWQYKCLWLSAFTLACVYTQPLRPCPHRRGLLCCLCPLWRQKWRKLPASSLLTSYKLVISPFLMSQRKKTVKQTLPMWMGPNRLLNARPLMQWHYHYIHHLL